MKQCTSSFMSRKLREYNESDKYSLSHCYLKASGNKESAFSYCTGLMSKYNGVSLRILSYNTFSYTVGFIGKINGRKAFFCITKDYDRYMYID